MSDTLRTWAHRLAVTLRMEWECGSRLEVHGFEATMVAAIIILVAFAAGTIVG